MPTEEDVQGMSPVASQDPYTGLQPESVYAIWHDPTTYDLMKHGPPYMPSQDVKVASDQKVLKDAVRPLVEKTAASDVEALVLIATHIKSDFGETPMSSLTALLAFMRAESMLHQAHHWQARGANFYADHELFDRIYNSLLAPIDALAERMVGSSHPILASPVLHAKHVSAVCQFFCGNSPPNPTPDDNIITSLTAVVQTLVVVKLVYAQLKHQGLLSHGTDNLLQGISDKHEEHVYLLKQRAMQKTSSTYDRRPVAASDRRWK
jgi:DNA-binding ferritin-like protein